MKKRIFLLILVLVLSNTVSVSCADIESSKPKIAVNGIVVKSAEAIIQDNRTYVPVRSVFEQIGCVVDWRSEDKSAKVSYNDKSVDFYCYDEDVLIIEGKMYIPLRKAVETLGIDINWNEETKTVNIVYENSDEKSDNESSIQDKSLDDNKNIITTSEAFNSNAYAYEINSLMPEDENYMFSPLSVKYAFAMIANGAEGNTQSEILSAFDIKDLDKFNSSASSLIDTYDNYKYITFNIENSVWLNSDIVKGGVFSADFKNIVENSYGGTAQVVGNDNAVNKINDWSSENLNGNLSGLLDSEFTTCVINSIYFYAFWENEFDESLTAEGDFRNKDGKTVKTDFMQQQNYFKFYEDDNIKILSMPYILDLKNVSNDVNMYVILNEDKSFRLEDYEDKMILQPVKVTMPKFNIKSSTDMISILKKLGITSVFDEDKSQMTKMAETSNRSLSLYINKILHDTYIEVNESGTRAGAETQVFAAEGITIPPDCEKEFTANRPFTYIVKDNKTNEILFMGEYAFAE